MVTTDIIDPNIWQKALTDKVKRQSYIELLVDNVNRFIKKFDGSDMIVL